MATRYVIEKNIIGKERVVEECKGDDLKHVEEMAEWVQALCNKSPSHEGASYRVSSHIPEGCR